MCICCLIIICYIIIKVKYCTFLIKNANNGGRKMKKITAIALAIALLVSVMIIPIANTGDAEVTEPVNLALSATATATDANANYPATNINDGDTSTRWAPGTWKASDLPIYMQLSWEEAVTFDTLAFDEWDNGGNRADGYTVSISDDGLVFTDIYIPVTEWVFRVVP